MKNVGEAAETRQKQARKRTGLAAQSALTGVERTNEVLEQRCRTLQEEVSRLGEASAIQAQQAQGLQERLVEATAQLKLLGAPLANSDGARNK